MRTWKDKTVSLNDDNTEIIVAETILLECGKCTKVNTMHFDKEAVEMALNGYASKMFEDMFGDLIDSLK